LQKGSGVEVGDRVFLYPGQTLQNPDRAVFAEVIAVGGALCVIVTPEGDRFIQTSLLKELPQEIGEIGEFEIFERNP